MTNVAKFTALAITLVFILGINQISNAEWPCECWSAYCEENVEEEEPDTYYFWACLPDPQDTWWLHYYDPNEVPREEHRVQLVIDEFNLCEEGCYQWGTSFSWDCSWDIEGYLTDGELNPQHYQIPSNPCF